MIIRLTTKDLIAESLKELAAVKPIDKITKIKICESNL